MKKLFILSIALLNFCNVIAQPISMFINASPISCNDFTYKIEVTEFGQQSSNILMNDELYFGDGSSLELDLSTYASTELDGFKSITKYTVEHSYPGPGIYTIAARFYNRSPNIKNVASSTNTTFHVETKIIIDPFLGCNSTPALEFIPVGHKTGSPYEFDISCIDAEGDSLSYQISSPLQMKDIPVVDYWIPYNYDSTFYKVTSKLAIDPYNGSLFLNSEYLSGLYTVAIKVNEWRKVDNEHYLISSSTLDFNIVYFDTENNPPQITGLQDTAIIVGSNFELEVMANDTDGDQIKFNTLGDFFELENNSSTIDTNFHNEPVTKYINFSPSNSQARSAPFKAIYFARDNYAQYSSLCTYKSMYIWITDKAHEPDQIQFFTARESNPGLIKLDWIDVDDELGYIIERSDKYFPEFYRLAVLPADVVSYKDLSVVNGNTYQYRIKAVGTHMSAYKTDEVSTTEVITSIVDKKALPKLKVFPNPSNGAFTVVNPSKIKVLEIHSISGKVVYRKAFDNQSNYRDPVHISTELPKGVYVLNVEMDNSTTQCKKILIN